MSEARVAIGRREDRFSLYQSLKPDLILFPELETAQTFTASTVWTSSLPGSVKTKFWLETLGGKNNNVVATRTGVFLPFKRLKTIVIDDPRHPGHFEEKSPRYWSYDVARKLAEIHNADLVVGMPVMSVDAYYHLKIKQYQLIELPRWQMPEIVISNQPQETHDKGSVLYFLPQKGSYRGSICRDCQTLQPYPTPSKCPQCGGITFRPYGIGTKALAQEVGATIIDKEHSLEIGNCLPAQAGKLEIVVATHKIFDYDLKFDTIIVSHIDHLLNLPDSLVSEKLRETLIKLAQMAREKLIIQTRLPNHRILTSLGDSKTFFEDELVMRDKAKLPPFARLVKLISDRKFEPPEITDALFISPVHQNIKGQYQTIVHLPPETPIGKYLTQTKTWRIEPDPEHLI